MMPLGDDQPGDYPRPQLRRDPWTSLDGPWRFAVDDDDRGVSEHWFARDWASSFDQTILVPFAMECRASGIGDTGFHPSVWYRRELFLVVRAGVRYLLHFGAIDYEAQLWVDGRYVGSHAGGYTAFSFDITGALGDGERHWIVVRARDEPGDPEVPRGKQDWELRPHHIWYHRITGIWRSVWMEEVRPQHVAELEWDVDVPSARICATLRLAAAPEPGTVISVALAMGDDLLAAGQVEANQAAAAVSLDLPALRNPQARRQYLWSPETPVLIRARIVVTVGADRTDVVHSYVGLREVSIDHGQFLLNGRPYYLRGVLAQGFWADSHFTAPDTDALRREVQLIKDLGFNAVRVHQKVEDPRMLYWADRLGLLVWAEMPSAYAFTTRSAERLMSEWAAAVRQQRNHPSVCVWVPVNESWGVDAVATRPRHREFVRAIASFTRALDASRPVVSNDGWEHVASDILTVHDYAAEPEVIAGRYATLDAVVTLMDSVGPAGRQLAADNSQRDAVSSREIPVVVSEFGGIAFPAHDRTWGYSTAATVDEFRSRLAGLFAALRSSPVLSGFCYTQLTDTLQEANGLLYADRTPKLPLEQIRAIVSGNPPAEGRLIAPERQGPGLNNPRDAI